MNIFFLAVHPAHAAELLCNAHVVKMLLETVQILYTVLHKYNTRFKSSISAYKQTHKGHPMVCWAAMARTHFYWLLMHGKALADEHARRYPNSVQHKCVVHLKRIARMRAPQSMPKRASVDAIRAGLPEGTLIATINPPLFCEAAPICIGDQKHLAIGTPLDLTASYGAYYAWKLFRIPMRWETVYKQGSKEMRVPMNPHSDVLVPLDVGQMRFKRLKDRAAARLLQETGQNPWRD